MSLNLKQIITPPKKSIPVSKKEEEEDSNYFEYCCVQTPAWHVCFSLDGKWLAVSMGSPDCHVRIYTFIPNEGKFVWSETLNDLHTKSIRFSSFAPLLPPSSSSFYVLATASFDGTVGIWQYQNKEDNSKNGDSTPLWNCMAQLEGHDNECKCVAWNPTCTLLATCSRDKTIWIWSSFLDYNDLDFECIAILNQHEGDVKSILFASSSDSLLSCSYDGSIRIWKPDDDDDDDNWYCSQVLYPTGSTSSSTTIWSLTMAPSGLRFLAAASDASIYIYYLSTTDNKEEWKCVGQWNALLPPIDNNNDDDETMETNLLVDDDIVVSTSYAPAKAGHGRLAATVGNVLQIYREAGGTSTLHRPSFELETMATTTTTTDLVCVAWHPIHASLLATAGRDGSVYIYSYGKE